ncbi:hypothetical protein [Thalassotalea sp. PP2-459]|uniref:hypothetical protein n=1 Tax=Thalassotalea sp. PP2-459 TaxID=1742724 RepID=UPI0011152191|nr:hypothetical protein [Thalassotalea sp. PP2-459]
MKEIELPITQTVSATLEIDSEGNIVNEIGYIVNDEISKNMLICRSNGGKVLYATTSLEQEIENFLLNYFMGPFIEEDPRRTILENELLKSNKLTLSNKKELLFNILNSRSFIKGKEKDQLNQQLKAIIDWRNAFAHGKVTHNTKAGCLLKYYSGGQKEYELNDKFWHTLVSVFESSNLLIKKAKENMLNKLYSSN